MIQPILAGAARPGLMGELAQDLEFLQKVGIEIVVSLTAEPLDLPTDSGFQLIHFPIPDMGIATPRAVAGLCERLVPAMVEGRPVLLHCRAGLGRTGTVGACCLVSLGLDAGDAILHLRTQSRFYIQTTSQQHMVKHYADHLRTVADQDELPPSFRRPASDRPADLIQRFQS
ncbi:MAG: tyrosine-protein phosphatase [Acidobacteriota bacterium]|nr:tyrosine-protein phosphatase [Acidobacteriota bacterium]